MKVSIVVGLMTLASMATAQTLVNPVIKSAGGIYDIPYADERPDPKLVYKIVVDINSASTGAGEVNPALERLARMINLHVVGGVPKENLKVVAVIHSNATYSVMSNEAYKSKYKTDNPNIQLLEELIQNGVEVFVCGQSLIGRQVDYRTLVPGVKIATAMLTTVTTYQLKGYAMLEF